jgi:hypothetical protein
LGLNVAKSSSTKEVVSGRKINNLAKKDWPKAVNERSRRKSSKFSTETFLISSSGASDLMSART